MITEKEEEKSFELINNLISSICNHTLGWFLCLVLAAAETKLSRDFFNMRIQTVDGKIKSALSGKKISCMNPKTDVSERMSIVVVDVERCGLCLENIPPRKGGSRSGKKKKRLDRMVNNIQWL